MYTIFQHHTHHQSDYFPPLILVPGIILSLPLTYVNNLSSIGQISFICYSLTMSLYIPSMRENTVCVPLFLIDFMFA